MWAAVTFTSLHSSRYEVHALRDRDHDNMLSSLRFALGNISGTTCFQV